MIYQFLFLCLLVSVDSRSVEKVSEKNVTKRAANVEFYPDWVPFKNKHGEELGEFVQVETKKKPKKRLALPANFKLKAVAAPESDYNDFGGDPSEAEGEDFEKKEWSDLNRQGANVTPIKIVNHADISDIDGVVNIITQPKPSIVSVVNKKNDTVVPQLDVRQTTKKPDVAAKLEENDYLDSSKEIETPKPEEKEMRDVNHSKKNTKKKEEERKIDTNENKNADEDDYDDEKKEKEKEKQEHTETERKESEARKALILNAVDELKARHKAEQIILSEKAKEEEIFKEELERDRLGTEDGHDKYDRVKSRLRNYDDYQDSVGSFTYDKYKINIETTTTTTVTTSTAAPTTRRSRKSKKRKNKKVENGKLSVFKNPERLSVFKNPEAYIITEPSTTTTTTTTARPKRTTVNPKSRQATKFSSKYAVASPSKTRDESIRISLVPEPSDSEGAPTLFFPQTKNKRKKKRGKQSTPNPDSYVAETVEDKKAENFSAPFKFKMTLPGDSTLTADTTGSDTKLIDTTSTLTTAPAKGDVLSTNSDAVSDVVAASTDHKEDKKGANYRQEKGGQREYSSSHEEVHGEHGKKAYEGKHEDTKQAKGHHDREDHSGEYVDRAGIDKKHHDEANHYGAHHHEEHGKKHAKYEESGKHAKGHSTKGSHDIHKKEEYEKRVEFFEEDGDSSEEEKHGGYNHEREHSSGGHFKKGKLEAGHHAHDKGDTSHHLGGGHSHGHKGHKVAEGHDGHGRHHQAHFQKAGKQSGKKWGHAYSAPGKVANLIAVDRRADQFYNGPQYYG